MISSLFTVCRQATDCCQNVARMSPTCLELDVAPECSNARMPECPKSADRCSTFGQELRAAETNCLPSSGKPGPGLWFLEGRPNSFYVRFSHEVLPLTCHKRTICVMHLVNDAVARAWGFHRLVEWEATGFLCGSMSVSGSGSGSRSGKEVVRYAVSFFMLTVFREMWKSLHIKCLHIAICLFRKYQ